MVSRSRKRAALWALALAAAAYAPAAQAQLDTTLVQPSIPIDYDRGRNVSVTDRPRPDYDPLGIRSGGLLIYPRVDVGLGFTDNVFLTSVNTESDAYALLAPSVRVQSDWSRHQVTISSGARLRRYFSEPLRNKDEWYLNALGRADLGSVLAVTLEGQAARSQEDPFTGEANSTVAALSSYRRDYGAVRGEYRNGRVRGILSYDHQDFNFSDVELTNGQRYSQRNRDRNFDTLSGQFEYAFSPSLAAYTKLLYSQIDYDVPLAANVPNRNSDGVRAIAGLSLDVSGFFRGVVGLGYTERNYDAPLYRDVSGFSAEGRLEYLPSELTTFTIGLRRVIQDSSLGIASAYFDNRASLRVDHELLPNLLLNASAEYAHQTYIGAPERDDIYRARGGARYLISRLLGIQGEITYGNRHRFGGADNFTIGELAGTVSLVVQR